MSKLENVIIKFKCRHCNKETEMSAQDLMDAGTEGSPYCDCTFEEYDLDVSSVYIKKGVKMSSIKYELVTPDMIREALGYKETNDGHTLTGQYIQCKEISDKLNKLIHSRYPYCEHGDVNCKWWNDE